jgi:hypothetical protein
MAGGNRIEELLKPGATLNGIDFVEVRETEPQRVYVHFINGIAVHAAGMTATIRGGDITPTVPAASIAQGDWTTDAEGRQVLALNVPGRGDFSIYRLALEGGQKLDPHLSEIDLSFYAFCVTPIDCAQPEAEPVTLGAPPPPIDYLSKDYESFRSALLDFSALRYPEWRERSEADFGMMMLEALSAVGDELSYLQDEGHRQARIETATSLRAATRLARLVDYEPAPVTSATTLLDLEVSGNTVAAGTRVIAFAADGSEIPFEIGTGLADTTVYRVRPAWHDIVPYWWDDEERCLRPGATSMYVEGHGYDQDFAPLQRILITTEGGAAQIVRLTKVPEPVFDPLFNNAPVSLFTWGAEDALRSVHDLGHTRVSANIVPATQGIRHEEAFAIGQAGSPPIPTAFARLAANSTDDDEEWTFFHQLANDPLTYLPGPDGRPAPELVLRQIASEQRSWSWVRRLLDAGRAERAFTLESGGFRQVERFAEGAFWDDDASPGTLIRFGGGDFGALPDDGDRFVATYRTSRGAVGNVAAGTITSVDPASAGFIVAVSNPAAATGGREAETIAEIRRRAPYAFQASTYRAVRPEDYNAAARQLPFVQRAGTAFRWTGSWPTIFTSIDPRGTTEIDGPQEMSLVSLLNRYRLAGYETYAPPPRFVSFDLQIVVCAKSDAYPGDVYASVDAALRPIVRTDGTLGFFHVDNFTLGTPFQRSRLEVAIQAAPGVAGVLGVAYRRRGTMSSFGDLPMNVPLGIGEIFRLDNDNNHPERGSYQIDVRGGR